jgi:hypothetical protein
MGDLCFSIAKFSQGLKISEMPVEGKGLEPGKLKGLCGKGEPAHAGRTVVSYL